MAECSRVCALVTFICFNVILISEAQVAQVLTPPTFNLAKGKNITASATCGYGTAGPELYCSLTGATGESYEWVRSRPRDIIQGQLCEYCDINDPNRDHPAGYAIDGTENWWQSPPLSRSDDFNKVDITIDLEQEFHIAYIIIKMANSPRPGVWALEKSMDYGSTWEPWQYFADTPADCENFFNTPADKVPERDDQVLCVTDFSRIVPLINGEIFVSLVNNRPNADNFSYADDLKEFMRATTVRLRLIRTKTLLGHLMAVANQDSTVTRRYFYSIKDISLGGRCVCNGHADTCNYLDPYRPDAVICQCQHNTVGDQCEMCDAANGYVQKKWQPARTSSVFECEPCECYGRATGCIYDAEVDEQGLSIDIYGFYIGGGVCQGCQYNTTGINCNECMPGYYMQYGVATRDVDMCIRCRCDPRYHIDECEQDSGRCVCRKEYTGVNCDSCSVGHYGYPDCIPCDCHVNGTEGELCHVNGGQCPCKENYIGKKCDMCQIGYYEFPECGPCECESPGTIDNFCKVDSGQCNCEMNYGTRNCSDCAHGFFNYPDCLLCPCDPVGSIEEICDKSIGECLCKDTFSGERCDSCARGFYAYPDCMSCECQEPGTTSNTCEDRSGQCTCKFNYAGKNCDRCSPGYYRYPDCVPCECDSFGSLGESCHEETGQCDCRFNFQGRMCSKCREGLYNYPNCEECNCNPAGAREVPGFPLGGCGEVAKGLLCECKEKVEGRFCDTCLSGYWNLNRNNMLGCERCACSVAGTIAGMNMCNMITGQCMCKVDVTGRNCDRCKDGFYGLHKQNLYGCVECNCDIGGSESLTCDKETGQCPCKPRVEGMKCDQPIRQHFIPTLDQLKYEIEDGYTPEGFQVRYGYDERLFPNFSWRGYAILMNVQPEVRLDLEIVKSSLYRIVYRFVNMNEKSVIGNVTLSNNDLPQRSSVMFEPTSDPAFASVGNLGGQTSFVMDPGTWAMAINTDESVFLDYLFLIPQAYYEATVLQNKVYRACTVPDDEGPCIHYSYPDIMDYPRVLGESGYIIDADGNKIDIRVFVDQIVLDELRITSMAILDPEQKTFDMDLYIPKKDRYVLVLNYYSDANMTQTILFNVGDDEQATAVLYNCQYSSLCRQVLLGFDELEGVFDLDEGFVNIKVTGQDDINAAIESIVAIPYDTWAMGYIRPSIVCIRINGVCIRSRYALPVGSVRIDFESLPNDHLKTVLYIGEDHEVDVVHLNDTQNMIVLLGTARAPGVHKFVVQYYMTYETGQDMQVTLVANGQEYPGIFRPRYCPNMQGCRGLIYFDETGETGNMNLIDQDVKVIFNNTSGQNIWLDYLLLVPSENYNPNDINLRPVDNSRNFIDVCLDDGFEIKTPLTTFCETSLFTLTTEFNNGALECECDIDGSQSFNCDPFGGQCQCRANVIGRTCAACRVGYYGFPRCQPCNCPFGLCHQTTGQCICPPRVTGDRCDQCKPESYGYDALIGCQDCACVPEGVQDRDLNCEADIGQCNCLPNIGGRKCEYCLDGFYAFPQCRECDCDRSGTTGQICDPNTAYCICKENVLGARCDQCAANTYNLDLENPEGCTSCFCFGNTQNCYGSRLYWDTVTEMLGWGITNTVDGEVREAGTTIAILDAVDKIVDTNTSMYWIAPDAYLGNKVNSYGGYLRYNLLFVLPRNESVETNPLVEADIILVGANNQTIIYRSTAQPFNSAITPMEIKMVEYRFEYPDTGLKVDRATFMTILMNLQALHIRASYYSVVHEVRLMEVEFDVASEFGSGEQALSVEECVCPYGYVGSSCEDCAPNYYRGRIPYLAVCVPCECNGHADSCDLNTGECLNCSDNTYGAHCELCLPGYYGDPERESCRICGCPLYVESNNFADTCYPRYDGRSDVGRALSCSCFEGYTGDRCERCAPGYYGNPMTEGSTCEACQCSDNLDLTDPESCDFQTGDCLICDNNSTGPQCEQCRDWWYGDAVVAKDCYPCACDECGSVSCNSQQGLCTCKPNVIGINCDRCSPDTYGFDSCYGCTDCECGDASVDSQCDMYNGTCICQPGVWGRRCESCIPGYWNYQPTGCEMCQCELDGAVTCDPVDGRCQCLAGVTGDRCDTCFDRWVLIPQEGCHECDTCTHNLLDDMDYLDMNISDVQDGLQTVSIGVFAMRRLDNVNKTVMELWPVVTSVLYESENITLVPVQTEFQRIETIANNVMTNTRASIGTAESMLFDAKTLVGSGIDAEKLGEMSEKEASDAILYISDILRQINEGIKVTNIETYIDITDQIIAEMRSRNFTMYNDSAINELDEAELLMQIVKEKQTRPMELKAYYEVLNDNIVDVNRRLKDLQNNSQVSEATSTSAMSLIESLRDETIASINDHVDEITMAETLTQGTIQTSQELINSSLENLDITAFEFRNLSVISSMMQQAQGAMTVFNDIFEVGSFTPSDILVNASFSHAEELEKQAAIFETMYTDTREIASSAVAAGTAYENIVNAIEEAELAADMALQAAESAKMKSGGVGDMSKNFTMSSEELLMDAKVRYNTTQIDLLGRLMEAKAGTDRIDDMNKDVVSSNNQVKTRMEGLPIGEVGDKANMVKVDGETTRMKANETKARVQTILDGIPEQLEKTIPLTIDAINTQKDIDMARTQVATVQKFIPNIQTLLTSLADQSEKVQTLGRQVTGNIAALKEKIAIARNQANLIRVGLNFLGNTSVTLRNPPNVAQAGSYSKASLFFKTTSANGLLLYAGSERSGASRPNQDYMSIEVKDGNVVYTYDLGNGPAIINHPHYVSDGQWYKVTAKRIGKAGTLTLEGEGVMPDDQSVTGKTRGLSTVLEMHPLTTKFYAGGLPAGSSVTNDVIRDNFDGAMESIEFDDAPMGIWNFEEADNNFVGARERNILTSVVSNGFRFDGTGYVTLSTAKTGWKPAVKSQVSLKFKTFAENGLLFFAGDGNRDFLSIEIKDGEMLYQFDLGGGRAVIQAYITVNDGEWHDVQVNRLNKTGMMFIDEQGYGPMDSPGNLAQLSITDDISVGGYHDILLPNSGVTKQGFEGCIQDLTLQLDTWDLNENKNSKGVSPGCPDQIARIATFSQDQQLSFVAKPSDGLGTNFDITFKMKTTQQEALLMYVGHTTEMIGFSVSMVDGMISVVSDPGGEKVELKTRVNTYNDGRWHYISIMKMGQKLMMNIDDYEMVQTAGKGDKKSLDTNTPIYFGNADIPIATELAMTTVPLEGCIGDVTINGDFLNFANLQPTKRPGILLSGCPIPDPEGPYDREVLPTSATFTFPTTTTAEPMPPGKCAMEATMPEDVGEQDYKGLYYGAYPNSRIEYKTMVSSLRIRSKFSMDFRTLDPNGVIFYYADTKHVDHISISINKGQIRYTFNSGTGLGEIVSPEMYNDGKWHMLRIGRSMKEGSLEIDGELIATTTSAGRARSINGRPPFFFGGLDGSDLPDTGKKNLDGITNSFRGCIANIKLNDKDVGEPPVQNGTLMCSDLTEAGAYFYDDGGYIKQIDAFKVGLDLTVEIQIRPRSLDGVIFSVHGSKGDYVILQMVEGELWFAADNGNGAFIAKFLPEMNNKLCDGSWHSVTAEKNKNVVILTVDNNNPITTTSSGSATSADTNNPVYLGGNPDSITKGVKAKGAYNGCMRNLSINGDYQYLITGVAFSNVKLGMCPVN